MSTRKTKHRSLLLIVLSWLLTRLWQGIELSRLTIFRFKPPAVINFAARDARQFPRCVWMVDQNKVYWFGLNESPDPIEIKTAICETN
jgi:hypothetical protein